MSSVWDVLRIVRYDTIEFSGTISMEKKNKRYRNGRYYAVLVVFIRTNVTYTGVNWIWTDF